MFLSQRQHLFRRVLVQYPIFEHNGVPGVGMLLESGLGYCVFRVLGHHLREADQADLALLFELQQGWYVSLGELEVVLLTDAVDLHYVDDISFEPTHASLYRCDERTRIRKVATGCLPCPLGGDEESVARYIVQGLAELLFTVAVVGRGVKHVDAEV